MVLLREAQRGQFDVQLVLSDGLIALAMTDLSQPAPFLEAQGSSCASPAAGRRRAPSCSAAAALGPTTASASSSLGACPAGGPSYTSLANGPALGTAPSPHTSPRPTAPCGMI